MKRKRKTTFEAGSRDDVGVLHLYNEIRKDFFISQAENCGKSP